MLPSVDQVSVRTLFISDVHLGMRGCQAAILLDFLQCHEADTIYLVGDIVDGWRVKPGGPWPRLHLRVVSELLGKARNGTRVIYTPGNHDEFLREFIGSSYAGIEIVDTAIHEGADGRRYLITHGDQFDAFMQHARWLVLLGSWAYDALLTLNTYFSMARGGLGLRYWSFSAWAKRRVKMAMKYVSRFEEHLSAEAKRHNAHGVVCGHIHHAADHDLFGVRYINAGDWVESCTGVLEHHDGRFEIVHWAGAMQALGVGSSAARARRRDSELGIDVLLETAQDARGTL